ncbi:MAG: 4Fe-4S dicluster domain-containing protein [Thermodesulfobacteriota bacterium]|jgi:Fe-S-cluster-containing dehydrogenase component/formate-dependent nitrite reductase membrane component NrfD
MIESAAAAGSPVRWAKVIDHTKCIGCHACSTACKSENLVPLSVHRTYVKYVDVGVFPQARRAFQVTRCNQCEHAPCTYACPTAAMYARPDGIVDFDKSICIGCKACIAACPYDAIFINPEDHAAEKCNFCAHRIDMGLEPACVIVCPTEAILVGDLNDPHSQVARIVGREPVTVRRPEKETHPKLFYKGAHQATLDPLAAKRPEGGLFLWSEQGNFPHQVTSGHPGHQNSSAAALLAYDVPHRAPWDWRLSVYTWTKGIAAGAYLIPLLLILCGLAETTGPLWRWVAPLTAGAFLALTGLILVADLDHPERFFLIFTRPQWRSWLTRGAFIIAGYAAVLFLHFTASLSGGGSLQLVLAVAGLPLSVLTAVYTAYLFAQATARDLWQSPLLPPHFLVQAVLVGSAFLLPLAVGLEPPLATPLAWTLGVASLVHLLLVLGEVTLAHPTAHARRAVEEMTGGSFKPFFWAGAALTAVGVFAPWLGVTAAPFALLGLLAHEHAYVQAGQAVPLA